MKTLDGGGLIRDVFSGIVRPEFESRALLIAFHAGRRHSLLGKLSLMKILFLKLAAWLIPRGEKMQLANEAAPNNRSAEHWKRKAAMAIGRPELADGSDDDLEAAHDAHMQAAYEMANAPDVELVSSRRRWRKELPSTDKVRLTKLRSGVEHPTCASPD